MDASPFNPTLPSPGTASHRAHVETGRAEPQPATVTCLLCGSANDRGLRYCVSCGHLLAQSDTAPAIRVGTGTVNFNRPASELPKHDAREAASAAPPLEHRDSAPSVRVVDADKPIAPARVVEVGAPTREPPRIFCPRCRGLSDPNAQYCRLCGAALATAGALVGGAAGDTSGAPAQPPVSGDTKSVDDSWPGARTPLSSAISRGRLVLIARDGGEGPRYPLGVSTDIGRTEGGIVFGDDRFVSPRHARIISRNGAYFIRDLHSTNGIFFSYPVRARAGRRR